MVHFPEEIFSYIKSFTKPEIWICECCEEEFNKQDDKPFEGLCCEDCYDSWYCSCGTCSKKIRHFTCEECEKWTCEECQGFYEAYAKGHYMGWCRECYTS